MNQNRNYLQHKGRYSLIISTALIITVAVFTAFVVNSFYKPVLLVLTLFGLVLGFLFLIRPWWGTLLFILSFPFIATLSRGDFIPGLRLDEALLIFIFIISMISPVVEKRFYFNKIDHVFIIVIGIVILSTLLGSIFRDTNIYWFQIFSIAKAYIIYRLVFVTIDTEEKLSKAIIFLLIPSIIVSVIAFLQLLNIGGMLQILAEIYPDTSAAYLYTRRATSVLGNWNALGAYSVLGILLSLALLTYERVLKRTWILYIVLAANLGCLAITGSSNSILGLIFGSLIWWLLKPKTFRLLNYLMRKEVLLLLIIFSIIFVVEGSEVLNYQFERQFGSETTIDLVTGKTVYTYGLPSSVMVRWYLARFMLTKIMQDTAALWVGFGRSPDAIALLPWNTPESGYAGMVFFFGIFFLAAYVILYLTAYKTASSARKMFIDQSNIGQAITFAVMISTSAIMIMNIIHSYYLSGGVIHYYWVEVGLMVGLIKGFSSSFEEIRESI